MAKSMEVRMGKIDVSKKYADVLGDHPVLKKGLFKPDLMPLCAKYDKNKKAYETLAQRKKNVSVHLDLLRETSKAYGKEVSKVQSDSQKVDKETYDSLDKVGQKLKGVTDEGEKADMSAVLVALKDFTAATESNLNLSNAHRNKEEKLDNQYIVNLKKICANYEKDSKAIKSEIDKLEADEDGLEAQIRKMVLSYQKTAVQIDNQKLETDLNRVLTAFP
jgi:hypothetical protein